MVDRRDSSRSRGKRGGGIRLRRQGMGQIMAVLQGAVKGDFTMVKVLGLSAESSR